MTPKDIVFVKYSSCFLAGFPKLILIHMVLFVLNYIRDFKTGTWLGEMVIVDLTM